MNNLPLPWRYRLGPWAPKDPPCCNTTPNTPSNQVVLNEATVRQYYATKAVCHYIGLNFRMKVVVGPNKPVFEIVVAAKIYSVLIGISVDLEGRLSKEKCQPKFVTTLYKTYCRKSRMKVVIWLYCPTKFRFNNLCFFVCRRYTYCYLPGLVLEKYGVKNHFSMICSSTWYFLQLDGNAPPLWKPNDTL